MSKDTKYKPLSVNARLGNIRYQLSSLEDDASSLESGLEDISNQVEELVEDLAADRDLVQGIHKLLDGVEWTPDTLDRIAYLLNQAGYPVKDIKE